MGLYAKVLSGVQVTLETANDFGNSVFDHDFATQEELDNVSKIFADTRTIAASSSETLDLKGSLTDPNGATVTFSEVVAILVRASAGNTNNVVIGGNGVGTAWIGPFVSATTTISIPPGGEVLFVDNTGTGWTVTAGTADILKMANSSSGSSVTYDIVIIGR